MAGAAIDAFHRSGNDGDLTPTLAYLAVFFDRIARPEIAATVYGTSTHFGNWNQDRKRHAVLDHLRATLGQAAFDECVAAGSAMDSADAVHYARDQIQITRHQLAAPA